MQTVISASPQGQVVEMRDLSKEKGGKEKGEELKFIVLNKSRECSLFTRIALKSHGISMIVSAFCPLGYGWSNCIGYSKLGMNARII